jgi:hypothetical protein
VLDKLDFFNEGSVEISWKIEGFVFNLVILQNVEMLLRGRMWEAAEQVYCIVYI